MELNGCPHQEAVYPNRSRAGRRCGQLGQIHARLVVREQPVCQRLRPFAGIHDLDDRETAGDVNAGDADAQPHRIGRGARRRNWGAPKLQRRARLRRAALAVRGVVAPRNRVYQTALAVAQLQQVAGVGQAAADRRVLKHLVPVRRGRADQRRAGCGDQQRRSRFQPPLLQLIGARVVRQCPPVQLRRLIAHVGDQHPLV